MSDEIKPHYYWYNQNNSGGGFDDNESVTYHVFIQAHDVEAANQKATELGIYFDGVAEGKDCDCCGDRWTYPEDTGETPKMYGELLEAFVDTWSAFNRKAYVYQIDGTKLTYEFKSKANYK